MKTSKFVFIMAGLLSVVPLLLCAASPVSHYADIVLFNGKVVTVDKDFTVAQAVAIRDGKFLSAGKNKDILALAGPRTVKMDLGGKTVIPGLIDSHNHMDMAEEGLHRVPLWKAKTVADALALIKEAAAKTKPGEWIVGAAWHPLAQLAEKRYLTRWEIDTVAPDNPVFLPTVGHEVMCNSYALTMAGIKKETSDPKGGQILRDTATGEPNGVLAEAAIPLVEKIVPPLPFDVRVKIFKDGMKRLNSAGLTGVVVGATDPDSFKVYQHIWAAGDATIRTSVMYAPTGELDTFGIGR